ncbi:hypothetical protein FAES_0829 [Fibrella aestuarina BUZ 2]|uniref:Uncharacterized protein n=1 Tax=Fibrella aestuarina BUZ 2 TaxID=1166018 RepID=I0K3Y7_9BACT|nr:hypothetical protein [Fibrella aestuarina]CCG98840.1 hypothetical protein FAES_0829 [Fibrella aestuarina BUZ 2]
MNNPERGPLSDALATAFVDRSPFGSLPIPQPGLPASIPPRVAIQYRYYDYLLGERLGEAVLTNTYAITVHQVKKLIAVLFYDGLYFDAGRCGLPCLALAYPHEADRDWHELVRITPTYEAGTVPLDIADFLSNALKQHRPQPFASRLGTEQPVH